MARVAVFSVNPATAQEITLTTQQYVKEVLELESLLSKTAFCQKGSLGLTFRAASTFGNDINILEQEADLHLFDSSPVAVLALARQLLDLYRGSGKREVGIPFAHEVIVLENVLPNWLKTQDLDVLYYHPAKDPLLLDSKKYFEAAAEEFGAVILPEDIDQATDEVGAFVEDILGMNPGE